MLTQTGCRSILHSMQNETISLRTENQLSILEERLDELIRVCDQLVLENQSLQARHATLMAEREDLIEQYEQARTRIDAMVARLRGLEQSP